MNLVHPGRPTRAETQKKTRVLQSRASGNIARRQSIPEYLDQAEIEALIANAPHTDCELVMMLQWRAGLRISEALKLEIQDLHLQAEPPVLRVRYGKGGTSRLVPIHSELRAAISNHIKFRRISVGRLFEVMATSTAWRWYRKAKAKAEETGGIPERRWMATHTLRHSAARHWLANGVPINQVSVWLGHASLQTTLIYLKIIPDPGNWMDGVP